MVLKAMCILLVFAGACIMTASIIVYGKTIKSYTEYLPPGKNSFLNLRNSIMMLMLFFLLGYLTTLLLIFRLDTIDMAISLIAVIFFFGAIFCFSVVYVQAELLNRLKQNANVLREALDKSRNANISQTSLNKELRTTMEALKKAQSQLVFSEKMSTLGKLVAGISHEINTPIGAVKASVQSVHDAFSMRFSWLYQEIRQLSDEDFDDYLRYAEAAVENTRQCTTTSKIRALKREAKKTLAGTEGFNEQILDLLEVNCLLDSDTIEYIAPRLNSENFVKLLKLVGVTVSIVKAVDNITFSAEKIIKIVSSMKAFSHFNVISGKTEFNVISGIETVLSINSSLLKYDVEVVNDFDAVPNIVGYEDELSQVWNNLIQNAVYAMLEGNNPPPGERRLNKLVISVKREKDFIIVAISDNGCGISPDKMQDIFEPFYTTKPTGIGSGLGLSISKQIIDKHNGLIFAESEEGHGTTFTVKLPL